jgi:2-(1,2-epoxy-1,2-dihydrophenyl)acetyl-CoA isomerase
MEGSVKLKTIDGNVLYTLNRPASFNVFGREMMHRLAEFLGEAAKDSRVTGVVITGQGTAFCTGGHLRWLTCS